MSQRELRPRSAVWCSVGRTSTRRPSLRSPRSEESIFRAKESIRKIVMQIILQEDVEKLVNRAGVITVKPGYAGNFLLPNKPTAEATPGNMKALERIRAALAKKTATELESAKKQAELLNGVSLKFNRKTGERDQMFGSVTTGDIADGLKAQSFEIDKRQVLLAGPLKALGEIC